MSDRKNKIIFVVIASMIAVIASVAVILMSTGSSNKSPERSNEDALSGAAPVNIAEAPTSDAVIVVDKDGVSLRGTAPTEKTLDVAYDYTCIYCSYFEQTYFDMIRVSTTEQGTMTYVARPISILSGESVGSEAYLKSTQTKTAALSYYIASEQPDKFLAFNKAIFDKHDEVSSFYTDELGKSILEEAGVSDDVATKAIAASNSNEWQSLVASNTKSVMENENFQGTPWIFVNGKELDPTINWLNDSESFINFLADSGIVETN